MRARIVASAREPAANAALVAVRNLSYTYPDGSRALASVSFVLQAGQRVGLIGPNGAGKSTLLLHLNGLLPEFRGWGGSQVAKHEHNGQARDSWAGVKINGLTVEPVNLALVRRAVGLVFQDPDDQLFCPTVGQDVAYGPLQLLNCSPDEAEKRARAALSDVGLLWAAARPIDRLSVGERKRACLAGVLACQPSLLALDEPTSNLDPRARRELIQLLGGLACSQLIATHDLELVLALCERAILLDGGRVVADGPARELLADARMMEAHGLERPISMTATLAERPV